MDREELHRRLEILREKLQKGEFNISSHLAHGFETSLNKIRIADDGLVVPETVDGRIRSTLHAVTYFSDRQDVKQRISLSEIQQAYFKGIDQVFGEPYELMVDANSDPVTFATWYISDEDRVAKTIDDLEDFLNHNVQFWKNISEPTWIHLEDATTSKAVFAGEIFPVGDTRVTNSTGIYFDTTILPDPFLRLSPLKLIWDKKKLFREILKAGLYVMSYKELALVELPRPIVAILPDRHILEEPYKEFIDHYAYRDTLYHANKTFGDNFQNIDEFKDFINQFSDANSVASAVKDPTGLLFDTDWDEDLPGQIERYMNNSIGGNFLENVGEAIFIHFYSRFSQANDAYQRSKELRGTPIIKAETSWYWFNRMLQYNSKWHDKSQNEKLHVAKALETNLSNKISWIANVPTDALIEIRKVGALDEIRDILGKGISDLIEIEPNNFFQTSETVINNLQFAFQEHENRIKDLKSKKWKFAGKDIGSFVGVGGIEVATAITGLPLYGGLALAASMSGYVPTFKDLKEKLDSIRSEQNEHKSSGIGILLKHKE